MVVGSECHVRCRLLVPDLVCHELVCAVVLFLEFVARVVYAVSVC